MKFRKKPVVIEAVQVVSREERYKPNLERPLWLADAINSKQVVWCMSADDGYFIETLEGTMKARIGDWIIKGVNGELYPCKPDIFEKTYEKVTDMSDDGFKAPPIKGYQDISSDKQAAVNANKVTEEVLLRTLDMLGTNPAVDQRWLAIGRTHIEQGFMAINRAIFKPTRVKLDGDAQ